MIINHFTDNDLYKFTAMNAIQKLYPKAMVRYNFINRGHTLFPDGFARKLRKEVDSFADIVLSREEEKFLVSRCYYFDPVFIDLLKGYRYDPSEVRIDEKDGVLEVEIEGLWYRTVLWEVPLLALISELFFNLKGNQPQEVEEKAAEKALKMNEMKAEYSDFGTRRRFSFDVHNRVVGTFMEYSPEFFKGTSNIYIAMKHNLIPIGTHPHEWFMFHASSFGYRSANAMALNAWVEVYKGDLGIALSDTYTSENFFSSFSVLHAKLFDGIRQDSGDPLAFTDRALEFYQQNRIDPETKTIVFSDALDLDKIFGIRQYVRGRIHDVYGIGTYLTNDVGVQPLNIVIKMTGSKLDPADDFHPAVKLSDDPGKYTGDPAEIQVCKSVLNLI
ncbi:MAG: nicotinate phosphoribosyltransferase [Bacteroidota bacterium]|nr:nicotinate phosphoribosyltransferase [Bacteroidota bacterium]